MVTTFLNTRTLTIPTEPDPPDGYVLTFDGYHGAYFAKPLSRILAISSPTSPYTPTTEDVVLVPNHVGVFTVNLPLGQTPGKTFYIKDFAGVAAAHNILVSGNGNNIDGGPSITLTVNYSGIHVIWSGASWAILSNI